MKKALFGGLLGLLPGLVVMLYFSWVYGLISFSPLRLQRIEFTSREVVMLFQCLLTGAIVGSITSFSGHWGLGILVGIVTGYGLGFIFAGHDDPPWDTIRALGMLLPVVFAGGLSAVSVVWIRMRKKYL